MIKFVVYRVGGGVMEKSVTKLSMMGFIVIIIQSIHWVGFVDCGAGGSTGNVGIQDKSCTLDGR
jgi:hypothetical protein